MTAIAFILILFYLVYMAVVDSNEFYQFSALVISWASVFFTFIYLWKTFP